MLRKTQHVKCILRATSDGWQACMHGDPIPPPRGHRPALDSVSFIVDTIRSMNEKKNRMNLRSPEDASLLGRKKVVFTVWLFLCPRLWMMRWIKQMRRKDKAKKTGGGEADDREVDNVVLRPVWTSKYPCLQCASVVFLQITQRCDNSLPTLNTRWSSHAMDENDVVSRVSVDSVGTCWRWGAFADTRTRWCDGG